MSDELGRDFHEKKQLKNDIDGLNNQLKNTKGELKKKAEKVRIAKRSIEVLQFDLSTLMKYPHLDQWPFKLVDIYNKHFARKDSEKLKIPESFWGKDAEMIGIGAVGGGGLGQFTTPKSMTSEDKASLKTKTELVRQIVWLNKKLNREGQKNKTLKREKELILAKIRDENVKLISDCNTLRTENQKISKHVNQLEVKFKEIMAINSTNVKDIERDMEKVLMRYVSPKASSKPKETPFVQRKNNPASSSHQQAIVDFYAKFTPSQVANAGALSGLVGDLEKNREVLALQNEEMSRLQVCIIYIYNIYI